MNKLEVYKKIEKNNYFLINWASCGMSNPDCMFEFHDEKTFGKLPNDDKYDIYEASSGRDERNTSKRKKNSYEKYMPRRTIFITDSGNTIYKNKYKQQRDEKARSITNSTKFDRASKYAQYHEITKRGCRCADIINNQPLSCEDTYYVFMGCGHCINDRCRFCLKLTEGAGPCDECLRFMKKNPGIVWYSFW